MNNAAIVGLASIGGEPIGAPLEGGGPAAAHLGPLSDLLAVKNGFYAFESALHVFPTGLVVGERSLEGWNAAEGWRSAYGDMAEGCLFFAEDVFGVQFCLLGGAVATFDPETGEKQVVASTVEEWAALLLEDPDPNTGYPLAHAWQASHGPLPVGHRLIPRLPFVVGGDFSVENLFALDAEKAMRARAEVAVQIRDLPDGTEITFTIT